MITIPEIQQIIMSNSPNPYYSTYMQYEQGYWEHIPGWINKCVNINTVLDIGCGYGTLGLFSKVNLNAKLYCVDFKQYISDELIKNYNINYCINNIELDEFPWDVKFDLIIFTEALEHMRYSPLSIFNKLKNLLTDNGVIMLSTPDASSGWSKVKKFYKSWEDMPNPDRNIVLPDEHIYTFDINELKQIFNIVGLKIDKLEYSESSKDMKHFNVQLSKK